MSTCVYVPTRVIPPIRYANSTKYGVEIRAFVNEQKKETEGGVRNKKATVREGHVAVSRKKNLYIPS